jgi:hypothetical protein
MLGLLFPRFVGTAPATTTMSLGAALVPESSWSDKIQIALPERQHATTPTEMIVHVPAGQKLQRSRPWDGKLFVPPWQDQRGPVPNDYMIASQRNYLPVHAGWISAQQGGSIYTLQGEVSEEEQIRKVRNWTIISSVVSAAAVGITAVIAVLEYRKRNR